jgi:TetR/AcrR family transcriptional regulator
MSGKALTGKKDNTIRQILEAAANVFADKGFAGARVDEIADLAGVNKATIYYHIGDKQALYARILHDIFGGTADNIEKNINDEQAPEEKIKAYAGIIAQAIERHPNVPRIMMYEFASGAQNFPDEVAKDLIRMFIKLSGILEDGVAKGVFTEANPFLIHFLTVGPLIFYKNFEALKDKYVDLPESGMLVKYLTINAADEIEKIILKLIKK